MGYITDDIVIFKPYSIICYRHLIRFMVSDGLKSKIYYLNDFADDDLNLIHAGLLKYAWENDTKINLFKHSNPDIDVLGIGSNQI